MRTLIPVVLLLGCGNKPSPDEVNALVDKAKNPKLHFGKRDVTINKGRAYERTFAVIVPDDWKWDGQDEKFYVDPTDHTTGRISSGAAATTLLAQWVVSDVSSTRRTRPTGSRSTGTGGRARRQRSTSAVRS